VVTDRLPPGPLVVVSGPPASVAALLAVAAESGGAVLESVWHRSYAADDLGRLPGPVVEVFCRCDPQVAARRYAQRAGSRHAGHFDAERVTGELWDDDEVARPVAGGWPVISVDTAEPVDLEALVAAIRAAIRAAAGAGRPG
jgi:hypothetical protein